MFRYRGFFEFALVILSCLSSYESVCVTGFSTTTTTTHSGRHNGYNAIRQQSKITTALSFWKRRRRRQTQTVTTTSDKDVTDDTTKQQSRRSDNSQTLIIMFREFVDFLQSQQDAIIEQIENETYMEQRSGVKFSNDAWGIYDTATTTRSIEEDEMKNNRTTTTTKSGGRTRVIQGGRVIEKGACSLTVIEQGILSAERAATMRGRTKGTNMVIQAGDSYSAAALSIVLHSKSPLVPTFRSDVRVFMVQPKKNTNNNDDDTTTMAWFGGGADLTPYYLFPDDIKSFHQQYRDLCNRYFDDENDHQFGYTAMKKACDDYFYLPARQEHRGTGGIFFDDLVMDSKTLEFVKSVAQLWMPSWLPIVQRRGNTPYTEQQKYWQRIRRGRYLEFNLLYDRGVKFGLFTPNPRVEGVMVSAPPEIAYPYNHAVEGGSPEAELLQILKAPCSWI